MSKTAPSQKKVKGLASSRAESWSRIHAIILAGGPSPRLGFPQALARFGGRSCLEIAVENCRRLGLPVVVVLGWQADRLRPAVPTGARVAVNRNWRSGQLGSLQTGLQAVSPETAFMLYPIDYPLLTPSIIRRLIKGFHLRLPQHFIVVPSDRGRTGHPVVFAPEMRQELMAAVSAKQVVEHDEARVKAVEVATPAIWRDFNDLVSYQRRASEFI